MWLLVCWNIRFQKSGETNVFPTEFNGELCTNAGVEHLSRQESSAHCDTPSCNLGHTSKCRGGFPECSCAVLLRPIGLLVGSAITVAASDISSILCLSSICEAHIHRSGFIFYCEILYLCSYTCI